VVTAALTLLIVHQPGTAAVPEPTGPRAPGPGGITTRTPYVAPTPNLTAVANGLYANAKSLSSLITVARGLKLTQPVTISIGYYSSAGTGRITRTYSAVDPTKPPYFLYHDREGDGKPRGLSEEITLTEPKPGGGAYSFVIRGYVWLDPFYDIKIDPLTFTLLTDCVSVGPIVPPTGISFMWLPPDAPKMNDDRGNNLGKRLDFSLGGGKSNTIFEFAWARAEVSAAANLHMPVFGFEDYFAQGPAFVPWINLDGSKAPPLVPGQIRTVQGGLKSDDGTCTASVQYTITYQLRRYGFGYY